MIRRIRSIVIAVVVASLCCSTNLWSEDATRFAKWEKAITAFEESDRNDSPPKNGAVFVGSSSIRMWDVKQSFPNLPAINRGFGGSQIEDSAHFADRIVAVYQPRVVVFYAGDNDINAGKKADQVEADFRRFVKRVHDMLPQSRILFMAIKPSPSRWKFIEIQRDANARIRKFCESEKNLTFVDVVTPMLGPDGQPRAELFLKDQLHMNADGYRLWTEIAKPHIEAGLK